MRMEDLDTPRVRPGYVESILRELEWLGLDWDEGAGAGGPFAPYSQSLREEIYAAGLRELVNRGLVFKCVCSRKDIRLAASAPHGITPVYPGTCRGLQLKKPDRPFAWRYRVPNRKVEYTDEITGLLRQDMALEVGDFVLRRSDGLFAYQLAVVIDDALMGITDVLRGMDLLNSTPRQVLLFEALNARVPRYWHVPLVLDFDGRKMSKRFEFNTVEEFRASGGTAEQLVGRLGSSLSLCEPDNELTARELLADHDLKSFRKCLKEANIGLGHASDVEGILR